MIFQLSGYSNMSKANQEMIEFPEIEQIVKDDIDQLYMNNYGFVYCPCCGVHLENGISHHDPEYDQFNREWRSKHDKYEYACLGCGEEFGPELEDAPVKEVKKTGKKHPKDMTLKAKCFECFDMNESVKDVQQRFGITYGNAHYHYRNWKKQAK